MEAWHPRLAATEAARAVLRQVYQAAHAAWHTRHHSHACTMYHARTMYHACTMLRHQRLLLGHMQQRLVKSDVEHRSRWRAALRAPAALGGGCAAGRTAQAQRTARKRLLIAHARLAAQRRAWWPQGLGSEARHPERRGGEQREAAQSRVVAALAQHDGARRRVLTHLGTVGGAMGSPVRA